MSASEPIELFDMRGVANVRKISSKEEAEDLLLGRPYGTYVVWRVHKFVVLSYQDPGCKEVAHNVVEKSSDGLFRMRNNAQQEGYPTLQQLLESRKYLDPSKSIDDISITTGDGRAPASEPTAVDEGKEQRRERLPIRLPPATTRRSYDEKQMEQEKMLSELWPEPKKRPAYTEQAWGRTLWWTCVIISIVGTAFAAVGTLPYLAHQDAAREAMNTIFSNAEQELEEVVGHIGVANEPWGTDKGECVQELTEWKGRLLNLEARLELAFDNSSASNALRHTVFSGVVAWGCLALLGVAGTPQGSMRKRIWLWRAVLAATWGITLTATALSLQYLTMCGETTQLLHMIPFWLRGVEAELPACQNALANMKIWLFTEPPHLHLRMPLLPTVAVPATRDVPFVVLVFAMVLFVAALTGFLVRRAIHHRSVDVPSKKKSD